MVEPCRKCKTCKHLRLTRGNRLYRIVCDGCKTIGLPSDYELGAANKWNEENTGDKTMKSTELCKDQGRCFANENPGTLTGPLDHIAKSHIEKTLWRNPTEHEIKAWIQGFTDART